MRLDTSTLIEHVHGHCGWLAAAMVTHPAVVLRKTGRRAHLAVILATAFVTIASSLGAFLYPAYRQRLKHAIFVEAPWLGWLFERKEHLAVGALLLAWAGAAAYFAAPAAEEATRLKLRIVAFRAYCASAALTILVAILGTVVAVYRTF